MINKNITKTLILTGFLLNISNISKAQHIEATTNNTTTETKPEVKPEPKWYDKLTFGGYTQFRYNNLPSFNNNDKLVNKQGDKTIGGDNGFSIRRARLKISGDLNPYVSLYFQTDFASAINDQLNVAIIRDLYTDIYLNKAKEFRIRVGQSKVPFGFENMQSSQNRLSLDRNDATNSGVKDERDLGVFTYWAPSNIRKTFKHLVESGLKGSGDYGVVGLGVYNGQGMNKLALQESMHSVAHLAYPFKVNKQYIELGLDGYMGKYRSTTDTTGTYKMKKGLMKDERVNASLIVYPQPFGFQAEGTYGTGASQGTKPSNQNEIKSRKLYGGYAQVMYKIDDVVGMPSITPYARGTYYNGGKKFEENTPHHKVKELELGIEWQVFKALEISTAYDMASRTVGDTQQKGHVTRLQVQLNY